MNYYRLLCNLRLNNISTNNSFNFAASNKEGEVSLVASWICDILKDLENESEINRVKSEVENLCEKFPVYSFKN